MLAIKDVLIFPIVCNSTDYKPTIGLIQKCTDLRSAFSKSSSFAILGSKPSGLKKAISNIILLPCHFPPNLHFGLLRNLAGV